MLFRRFPFEPKKENTDCDQRVKSMKKKIMQKPKFKKTHDNFVVSAEAIDFIKCLLVKQDRRLGYGQNGFQNVKSHKFFKDYEIQETSGSSKIGEVIRRVDWTLLLRKEVSTEKAKGFSSSQIFQGANSKQSANDLVHRPIPHLWGADLGNVLFLTAPSCF